jgi:hypothetical protein
MAFNPHNLIDQTTGEFDWTYIKREAVARAQRVWGDCAPPVSSVRSELLNLQSMASAMRADWRRDHGLPDDTEYVTVTSFAKPQDGVRRSAF